MPQIYGKPVSCGDCDGHAPMCRCCPYGVDEHGQALRADESHKLRSLPSLYRLGHNTHRWSGWPGAYCMLCGISDPFEEALNDYPFDLLEFYQPSCPFCPHVPYGVDPYTINPSNPETLDAS